MQFSLSETTLKCEFLSYTLVFHCMHKILFGISNVDSTETKFNVGALSCILCACLLYCVGMMIETMAGKSAALHGLCHDATPFTFSEDNSAVDYFGRLLKKGFCSNLCHSVCFNFILAPQRDKICASGSNTLS